MAAEVFIDGNDVSDFVVEGSSTRRLNRISQAQARIPMHLAVGSVGDFMKVVIDGDLHHHGRILNVEASSGEDTGYVVYNSSDAMELWQWRPARDADGDFSLPTFIEDFVTGPQIMEEILTNSETYEGDLFLAFGSFEGGGVDLTGAPTDWPMTIAEIASLLCDTGELDIVITPIDAGGNIGQVDCYNGDFGTDLSGSVVFEYATGARNVKQARWNRDMTTMCNKLWYYLGPRVGTADDPAGDQHWRANITGDDPGLADPPQSDIETLRTASQGTYGVRMDIRIFDGRGDEALVGRDLYRRLWQIEQWVRAQPREIVHIEPNDNVAIGDFDIGDLVGVELGSAVMGGTSGTQRVYEYTIGWNSERSTLGITELQTSPNGDGI